MPLLTTRFLLKNSRLFLAEMAFVVGFATITVQSIILIKDMMPIHQIFLLRYRDGTLGFGVDVTGLVRSLGVVNLLTLTFGLALGAALVLTLKGSNPASGLTEERSHLSDYERALANSGLVQITRTEEGTTYEVTEMGRRFLFEYADLQRTLQELS